MTLPFDDWERKYRTELVYTKQQMVKALEAQAIKLRVNRVVQSFSGRYGPTETRAMKILAIHETPEGTLVIVE